MTEIWKQIPFAHLYEISSLGRLRNIETKKVKKSPDIEKLKKKQTRVRYCLKTNVKTNKTGVKGFYLNRIIAITFLENPNNYKEVNHIDGNPYNNILSNVEWCSRKENMKQFNKQNDRPSYRRLVQIINKETNEIEKELKLSDVGEYLNLEIALGYLYKLISQKKKYINKGTCGIPGRKSKTGLIGITLIKTVSGDRWKASKLNQKTRKHYFQKNFNTKEEAINYYNTQIELLPENIKNNSSNKKFEYSFDDENRLVMNNKIVIFKNKKVYGGEDNIMDENIIWKEFQDNKKYLVSNTGLVKHKRLNRIMKGFNRNGYRQVTLNRENMTRQPMLIHRLVALTFIPNPENKPYVDHIDGGRRNNHVDNLRWATPKENSNNEKTKEKLRELGEVILQLDLKNNILFEGTINSICKTNKWECSTCTSIYGCCNTYNNNKKSGQRNLTYKGFMWCFKKDYNKDYILIKKKGGEANKKRIKRIDIKTGIEKIYDSISDASKEICKERNCGINGVRNYISVGLNKKRIVYNYKWEFICENNTT